MAKFLELVLLQIDSHLSNSHVPQRTPCKMLIVFLLDNEKNPVDMREEVLSLSSLQLLRLLLIPL